MPIGTFFKKLFSRSTGQQELLHPDEEAIHDEALKLLPLGARRTVRYPPFIEGFPAYLTSDYLLGLQDELYLKLLGGVGLPKSQFDEIVRPVILNYARFVHLLPASENHHHCGPGGLLRHGLEVACFAMNGTKNTAFDSRRHPSERSHRAVRWNVAGLLCGLLHDTGKAVTDMQIVYPPNNLKWVHSENTVEEWAKKHGLRKYYIEWSKGRHQRHLMKSRDLVMTLCPPQTLTWLMDGGEDIVDALMDAISGNEDSPLFRPLMMADGKSTKLDIAVGEPQYMTGVPVIRLLTNAMTRLMQDGKWKVNTPGARVWTTTQGVFVAWNMGAQEIIDVIVSDRIEAIPRTPNTLLYRLIDQSVAERSPDGELYWEIAPDCLQKSDKPLILRCMKLVSPDTLFAYDPVPAPVSVRINQNGKLVEYPAETETIAQSSAAALQEREAAKNPVPSIEDEQGSKESPTPKPTSKRKKKTPAPQTSTSHSELPTLVEDQETVTSETSPAPVDPILESLAGIEIDQDDESGRQNFLDSALLCMSGLASEPGPEEEAETEPAAQPAPIKKNQFTLNLTSKQGKSSPVEPAESAVSITLERDEHNEAPAETSSNPIMASRSSVQGKQVSLNKILDQGNQKKKKPKQPVAAASTQNTESHEAKPAPSPGTADQCADILCVDGLKLTAEEQSILNTRPDLAKHIIAKLNHPDLFNAYLRRVFIPLKSAHPDGLDDLVVSELIACGWVWHDFTNSIAIPIYTANKYKGVALATWLGNIITRNIDRSLQVATAHSIGDEKAEELFSLVNALIEEATPEKLPGGNTVLSLTLHKIKQVTASLDASHDDGLTALHLHRDTVYTWRRKVAHILPLEGELKRLTKNG